MSNALTATTDAQRLEAYLQAERAILLGNQSYTVDGMTFTRADLGKVQGMISLLRQSLPAPGARPTVGGIVTTQVVF